MWNFILGAVTGGVIMHFFPNIWGYVADKWTLLKSKWKAG